VAFMRIGHLRKLAGDGSPLPSRGSCEADADDPLHIGAPPDHVNLFAVIWNWAEEGHPDSNGERIRQLVSELDKAKAHSSDLLYVDFISLHVQSHTSHSLTSERLFAKERTRLKFFIFTNPRVQTVVMFQPIIQRGLIMVTDEPVLFAELQCATFCQRILNRRKEDVKQVVACAIEAVLSPNEGRAGRKLLQSLRVPSIREDGANFYAFCDVAQLAWLKVSYVQALAKRGGPYPRRQDLSTGGFHIGAPPEGVQVFTLSYPWSSQYHPSPNGCKLKELVTTLDKLNAQRNDLVFIDYCSLPQAGRADMPAVYFQSNELSLPTTNEPMAGKSPVEQKQFGFALSEMARLYVFKRCRVVVLPQREDPNDFPIDANAWGLTAGLDDRHHDYHRRGWCVSEYATARKAGTIANARDNGVVAIEESRAWPNTFAEYKAMMADTNEKSKVSFTNSGDREVVSHIFFRMAYSISGRQIEDRVASGRFRPSRVAPLRHYRTYSEASLPRRSKVIPDTSEPVVV